MNILTPFCFLEFRVLVLHINNCIGTKKLIVLPLSLFLEFLPTLYPYSSYISTCWHGTSNIGKRTFTFYNLFDKVGFFNHIFADKLHDLPEKHQNETSIKMPVNLFHTSFCYKYNYKCITNIYEKTHMH